MGCCGKVGQIVDGYTRLVTDTVRITRRYEFADSCIRECQKCDKRYWIARSLWCSLCKCFVPAAARAKDKNCPLDKPAWKKKRLKREQELLKTTNKGDNND